MYFDPELFQFDTKDLVCRPTDLRVVHEEVVDGGKFPRFFHETLVGRTHRRTSVRNVVLKYSLEFDTCSETHLGRRPSPVSRDSPVPGGLPILGHGPVRQTKG